MTLEVLAVVHKSKTQSPKPKLLTIQLTVVGTEKCYINIDHCENNVVACTFVRAIKLEKEGK